MFDILSDFSPIKYLNHEKFSETHFLPRQNYITYTKQWDMCVQTSLVRDRSIVIDSRFQVTNTQIIHFLKLTMTSLLISMTIAMVALQFQPQSQS